MVRCWCQDRGTGDEASVVRRLAWNRGTALLAKSGVAFALVTSILDGPELDRCLELIEPLIRDALMNAKNRGRLGRRLYGRVDAEIELLYSARGLDLPAVDRR